MHSFNLLSAALFALSFTSSVFAFDLERRVDACDLLGKTLSYNSANGQCKCLKNSQITGTIKSCPSPDHELRGIATCGDRHGCGIDCFGDLILNYDESDCGCPPGFVQKPGFKCQLAPSPHARARRNMKRSLSACPSERESMCALSTGGFECLDVSSDLSSCGACIEDGGVDCSAIVGVKGVTCDQGKCIILSCRPGFYFAASAANDGTGECIDGANPVPDLRFQAFTFDE